MMIVIIINLESRVSTLAIATEGGRVCALSTT